MGFRPNSLTRLLGLRPAFRKDSRGGVLPVIAISLPVIFGFAMLAVDAGRYFNLHTSVQWAADALALALAGAAELDRKPDAITRANRAIDNLGDNAVQFDRRYLKALPASDGTVLNSTYATTLASEARYVEISVRPVNFTSY